MVVRYTYMATHAAFTLIFDKLSLIAFQVAIHSDYFGPPLPCNAPLCLQSTHTHARRDTDTQTHRHKAAGIGFRASGIKDRVYIIYIL